MRLIFYICEMRLLLLLLLKKILRIVIIYKNVINQIRFNN